MSRFSLISFLVIIVSGCLFPFWNAWAQITQTVGIASSPNPVGSGARALGMGGAFIGVADDATAASLETALKESYTQLGYSLIEIPILPVEARVDLILDYVSSNPHSP